jgi:hypothetical protein
MMRLEEKKWEYGCVIAYSLFLRGKKSIVKVEVGYREEEEEEEKRKRGTRRQPWNQFQ